MNYSEFAGLLKSFYFVIQQKPITREYILEQITKLLQIFGRKYTIQILLSVIRRQSR